MFDAKLIKLNFTNEGPNFQNVQLENGDSNAKIIVDVAKMTNVIPSMDYALRVVSVDLLPQTAPVCRRYFIIEEYNVPTGHFKISI